MLEPMLLKKKALTGSPTTWSPSLKDSSVTLSNGNLTANCSDVGGVVLGTISKTSGKWYFEVKYTQFEQGIYSPVLGVATSSTAFRSPWFNNTNEMLWYYGGSGSPNFIYGANQRVAYGVTPKQGDIVGIALDMDAKTIYWIVNGAAQPTLAWGTNNYSAGTAFFPAASSPNSQAGSTIVDWQPNPQYCPSGYGLW